VEALAPNVTDLEWIAVEESSAPGHVRRAAMSVARQLGFSEHRVGEVAIAATELATNLHLHAKAGVIVLRERRCGEAGAIELIVADSGPGMADLDAFTSDGRSSNGTLGIGLGAVVRMATWFDAYSLPGRGTVMVATFWQDAAPCTRPAFAAVTRPINSEIVCGDAWAERTHDGILTLMLADGLGHGVLAAGASSEAVLAFRTGTSHEMPADAIRYMHDRLRATRGAAVAVVRLDPVHRKLTFAGIGNIAAWVDDGEARHGLLSTPGIVGHNARKFSEMQIALPPGATVILHSDGLTSKWDLGAYPGLRSRDAHLVAATLMRDAAVHHDDASILVAQAA
jgi:anti-sigma regulatory factor (Ser/Thr protein kinase)